MADVITLGVRRHVQGLASSREQIQSLAHELDHITKPPLARSTWGDALASTRRTPVLHQAIAALRRLGLSRLPDRLGDFAGLAKREVYAVDGSDQAACNAGLQSDQRVALASSGQLWRLVEYRTPRGRDVRFPGNDFSLEPGVLACI